MLPLVQLNYQRRVYSINRQHDYYHNAAILSALYEYYTAKDPEKTLEIIHWSPVTWRFVNLIGNYEFYRKDKIINIHEVIDKLITDFEIDFLRESLE